MKIITVKKLITLFWLVALVAIIGEGEAISKEMQSITYYGAKQAFARLTLYLREHKKPLPKAIWKVDYTRGTVYSSGKSGGRSIIIGEWSFWYEDRDSNICMAHVDSRGKIEINEVGTGITKHHPRAVQLHEWVLNYEDANMVVLKHGGESWSPRGESMIPCSVCLEAVNVEGLGTRPVWACDPWNVSDKEFQLIVDAQTGGLYRPKSKETLEPIEPKTQSSLETEWDSGFDKKSKGAVIGKLENHYWWPRAYRSYEEPEYFIYNRKLLLAKLQKEKSKKSRSASSWMTSGGLNSVLGRWVDAVDDLNRAVEMEPNNHDYRHYRGFVFMVIRDLDKAALDFQSLPNDYKNQDQMNEIMTIIRGERDREDFSLFWNSIKIDAGIVPLKVQLGPIKIASRLNPSAYRPPSIPEMPIMPKLPTVPDIPPIPEMPSVLDYPTISKSSTVPETSTMPDLPLLMDLAQLNLKITKAEIVDKISDNGPERASVSAKEEYKLVVVTLEGTITHPCRITTRTDEFAAIYEKLTTNHRGERRMESFVHKSNAIAKDNDWAIPPKRGWKTTSTYYIRKPSPIVFKVAFVLPWEITNFFIRYPALAKGKVTVPPVRKGINKKPKSPAHSAGSGCFLFF